MSESVEFREGLEDYIPSTSQAVAGEDEYLEGLEAGGSAKSKSVAQRVIKLALARYDFGVDLDGNCYAVRRGRHVVRPLKGERGSFRQEIAAEFFERTGLTASANALAEAMQVLTHRCLQANPVAVSLRVARPNDIEIFIDLGDVHEHVVRITSDGWEVLGGQERVPVLFRRTALTAALPMPEHGGDLEKLWSALNVRSEGERQVLRGWLVSAIMLAGLPCPILALVAEQGTAKTTAMRRVLSLFDPTAAPVRRPPNDPDKLLHGAHGSRATGFDNLSHIPQWMSDAMCRIVTGESDADRSLYTDGDLRVIKLQGVLVFTAIDVGAFAGDLAERCVWANLEVMPPSARRSERELNAEWNDNYPSMVGGLFDLVTQTMKVMPSVSLAEKPRMADFAEVLASLDIATGSRALEYYVASQASVAAEIVDTDPFLVALTAKVTSQWQGSGKELHALLPKPDSMPERFWPTARSMNAKLRRFAPDLRKAGWTVDEIKADPISKRAPTWVIEPSADALAARRAARGEAAKDIQHAAEMSVGARVAMWREHLGEDVARHLNSAHNGFFSAPECSICKSLVAKRAEAAA